MINFLICLVLPCMTTIAQHSHRAGHFTSTGELTTRPRISYDSNLLQPCFKLRQSLGQVLNFRSRKSCRFPLKKKSRIKAIFSVFIFATHFVLSSFNIKYELALPQSIQFSYVCVLHSDLFSHNKYLLTKLVRARWLDIGLFWMDGGGVKVRKLGQYPAISRTVGQ